MKKLKLELDSLRVQTFDTSDVAPASGGTVRGHDSLSNQDDAYTDQPSLAWWQCFTLTCICGASEKALCSAGCPW